MSSGKLPPRRGLGGVVREQGRPFLITFSALLAFWLVLSGHWDPLHVAYGAVSAALVTFFTRDLGRIGTRVDARGGRVPVFTFSLPWPRFLAYLPWLLGQIVLANLQVAAVILRPRLPIEPAVVRFRSRLRGDLARTTLGNSITLTPGTITVDVDGEEFVVHALTREAARQILDRTMERRIARVFGEG